jgi:hypothetical protein
MSPLDVVEHHESEQQRDRQQPGAQDVLPRACAERASLRRFENVQEDLTAVEDRYGQKIQHRHVDAEERNEHEQRFQPTLRRLDRYDADGDRAAKLRCRYRARE